MYCKHTRLYVGQRVGDRTVVIAADLRTKAIRALDPARSLALRSHSPTGFEWGYAGSGPAQLALAILLDATDDPALALANYLEFKFQVVARWWHRWSLSTTDIEGWLCVHHATRAAEASR